MSESRDPGDTRENILIESTRLFALKGFEAVGISEICRTCGITKPSLYYYFAGKDALLLAVLQRALDAMAGHLGEALDYHGDISRDVRELFAALFAFAAYMPSEYRVLMAGMFTGSESSERRIGAELFDDLIQRFRAFFTAAADDHGNLRAKDSWLASSFLAQAMARIVFKSDGLSGADRADQALTEITQSFLYGIF
jgi:AcrR family transcriptional regulator